MPRVPSLDDLRRYSPEKRLALYRNAQRHPEGAAIVALIDDNGLSLRSGALADDDPVSLRMDDIIWSLEGRAAAEAAVRDGLPALSGVDLLLQAELGALYHKHDLGTASAGFRVAELMRHLGYRAAGQGKCAPGCVARTGETWVRK